MNLFGAARHVRSRSAGSGVGDIRDAGGINLSFAREILFAEGHLSQRRDNVKAAYSDLNKSG